MKLRTAFAVSLALHVSLILIPVAGLRSGTEPPGTMAGEGYQVSLFESPGAASPIPGPEPAPAPVKAEASPLPEPDPVPAETALPAPDVQAEPGPSFPADPARGGTVGSPGADRPGPAGQGGEARSLPRTEFTPPQLLAGALPIDPEDSEALDVPDEIPVRLRVGTEGQVLEIVPGIADLPPAITAALEHSARAMRFVPARRGDRPVEAWFAMTFVFRR